MNLAIAVLSQENSQCMIFTTYIHVKNSFANIRTNIFPLLIEYKEKIPFVKPAPIDEEAEKKKKKKSKGKSAPEA